MTAKNPKCELKFLVETVRRPGNWSSSCDDGTLYSVTIRPVYVWDGRTTSYKLGDILSPSYSDWRDDAHAWPHLAGLEIHAQAESGRDSGWYGTDATFEGRRITAGQAKSMASVLGKITKALTVYRETYGYESGPAQTAAIIARACGATSAAPFLRYLGPGEADPCGMGKREMTADALGYFLADVLAGKTDVKVSTY